MRLGCFFSACGWALLSLMGGMAPVWGNPTGGTVVAGSASIGAAGATLSINQSTQNAIINWQQFSIANGETTQFLVPNGGATLNRVTGGNPSAIYGNLQSNGTLYLVNPSGIVVGPSGRIDTAGFLASTLDVSNQQFLKGGDFELSGNSGAAVENEGVVHASTGDVYLIANEVDNKGEVSAPQGTVGLAVGSEVLFRQAGEQHLFVQATPAGTRRARGVTNSGTIHAAAAELKAAGGNAYALAINNTGVIAATGYKKVNGEVYLTSSGGSIGNSGRISARQASGNGGTIVMDGTAAAGSSSGAVTNSGTLDASATVAGGQGGTVTLKNISGAAIHSGTILAKGGQGGVGGNAEVSGATVGFTGTVDLTAAGGTTGNLLLDPTTLDVVAGGAGTIVNNQNDSSSTMIDPATVEAALASANLTLNANTNITVTDGITWTSGTTLTLSTNTAGSTIDLNGAISGANGGLIINAAAATDVIHPTSAIAVATFVLQSGSWQQSGSGTLPAFSASQDFEVNGSSLFIRSIGTGTGVPGAPYEITDIYGLQGMDANSQLPGVNAVLINNTDASGTVSWNGGAGFVPIGLISPYTGIFNGQGFTIDGLHINLPGTSAVGLFSVATNLIENVNLTNVQVAGGNYVGGLVGATGNTIGGTITTGIVQSCSSSGTVLAGGSYVGGLVGLDHGTQIVSCYSAGTVVGGGFVGGLTGSEGSQISDDYSTAGVLAGGGPVGGLVGENYYGGVVHNCYSTGLVNGSSEVGGLVGRNLNTIDNSFWDTTTSGITSSTGGVGSGGNTGVTAATTAQLSSETFILANAPVAPTWDFTNVWTTGGGRSTPQLIGLSQSQPPVTSSTPPSNPPPPSTTTGGAAGAGSTIVPPALVPQAAEVTQQTDASTPTTTSNGTDGSEFGSQPPPFSFAGNGVSTFPDQAAGGLADAAGDSGLVGTGDVAQLNGGQLNNAANPEAASSLNLALGPIVYQNLADALKAVGDWADVPDSVPDTAAGAGAGETLLTGGEVAEMTGSSVKNIPLDQAPKQLQNAMNADPFGGVGGGH